MIVAIIKELESNNSSTFKKEVLSKYAHDDMLKTFIVLTYDTSLNYYISSKRVTLQPSMFPISQDDQEQRVIWALQVLSGKTAKVSTLFNALDGELDSDHLDLFKRVLNGSLAKGVSVKSINSVFGDNFIQEYSYQRCSGVEDVDNIIYSAFAQLKSDGAFYNTIVNKEDATIKFISRNGKELKSEYLSSTLVPLLRVAPTSVSISSEMLVIGDDGKVLPREEGNGKISSLAHRETTTVNYQDKIDNAKPNAKSKLIEELRLKNEEWEKTEKNILFRIWDAPELSCWYAGKDPMIYEHRFAKCRQIVEDAQINCFTLTPSKEVWSLEEAWAVYAQMIEQGEEGIVLKNKHAAWADGTSKHQIKFKEKKQCELLVTGWNPGEGEFKDGIGSLICESSDGVVKVNISGMKRWQRGLVPVDDKDMSKGLKLMNNFDLNCYTGKIITVEFNGVLAKKGSDGLSLFLPVIIEVRDDKDVADDSNYIKGL